MDSLAVPRFTQWGVVDALAALNARDVTAVELVEACSAQAEADADLNSIVRFDTERALVQADTVDRLRAQGRPLPPMAGLPVTIKDSYDVAGLDSGQGLRDPDHRALTDAPAVGALRAAGCVVLGKTNVATRLADYQSDSAEFGQTRNPHDRARTAGGSSGGGAAVASGQTYLDLGSDMAGSVRLPVAFCGIAGWRPTHGLVSKAQHLPWPPALTVVPPASTPGLLARHVRDLLLPASVLAGVDVPRGPRSVTVSRRIGVWTGPWPRVGSEVARAIDGWVQAARAAGLEVVPISPNFGDQHGLDVYNGLIAAEIAHGAGDLAASHPLLDLLERQRLAVLEWESLTCGLDAVIAPAAPVVAPELSAVPVAERVISIDGREYPAAEMLLWSTLTSLPQAPCVTATIGSGSESLMPVGVQFIGRRHHDLDLIAAVAALEAHGLVGQNTTGGT